MFGLRSAATAPGLTRFDSRAGPLLTSRLAMVRTVHRFRVSVAGNGVEVPGLSQSPPQEKRPSKNAGILSHSLSLRNTRALLEATVVY